MLTRGQRLAERRMTDTCTVRRQSGVATDPLTGASTPTYVDPNVYEGKCEIGGDRPYEGSPEAGGATHPVQRHVLKVPHDAGPFAAGDVVEITSSQTQPLLVGNMYRIAGPDERSRQTSQRMYVTIG